MVDVRFYSASEVEDALLKFAVIVSRYQGKWVLCKHKDRDTFEIPGGHREPGEDIDAAAHRELYEETGATTYTLEKLCAYSATRSGEDAANEPVRLEESFGMLYYAEIDELSPLPALEIASVHLFHSLPEALTYPLLQPLLLAGVQEHLEAAVKGTP